MRPRRLEIYPTRYSIENIALSILSKFGLGHDGGLNEYSRLVGVQWRRGGVLGDCLDLYRSIFPQRKQQSPQGHSRGMTR